MLATLNLFPPTPSVYVPLNISINQIYFNLPVVIATLTMSQNWKENGIHVSIIKV
jgi:hypothetical protein